MSDCIVTNEKDLRQLSIITTMEEAKELRLRQRLKSANKTAWTKGAGLTAIQIGVPLRFAWFSINGSDEILLNPEIVDVKGQHIFKNEGCLSIPESYIDTERYSYIEYISEGKLKKAMNFKAVLIQHEIDHMNGTLNIDRKL
jgi:peptide deformylase